jgi:integrase
MANKSLPQEKSNKPQRRRRKLPTNVFERKGRWYVKIKYRGADGRSHRAVRKCAKNPTDAKEVRDALKLELQKHGPEAMRENRRNFADLAEYYEANYLIEARYADGRKVAGRRDNKTPKYMLRYLRRFVGDSTPLRSVDYEFVRGVRIAMLADPVVIEQWQTNAEGQRFKVAKSRTRSIVDVNRKMSLLRHMLRVAKRKKWIIEDPFIDAPKTLITPADEKKRRRLMSADEEERLLAACDDKRDYLRLLVLGLAYTLMRSESEFFKLRVRDLDFTASEINVQQMNTKTLRARRAPLPDLFADEARRYIETHQLHPDDRLFPFKSVKRSWTTLKRKAAVEDLRIKDLRRTAATRLHREGMPLGEVSELLGHTTIEMTKVYIGVDTDTTRRANELLNRVGRLKVKSASDAVN